MLKPKYKENDIVVPNSRDEWTPNLKLIKIHKVNKELGSYTIKVMLKNHYDFDNRTFEVSIEDTDRSTFLNTKAGKVLYGKN